MGSNLNMTRTPDCHFAAEARHNGTKMVVFSPDFNQVAKYADEWIAVNAGQDGAWWMAVNHVLLKEFHHDRKVPYFLDYTSSTPTRRSWSSSAMDGAGKHRAAARAPGGLRRPIENGEWKFLMWDERVQAAQDADGRHRLTAGQSRRRASGTSSWRTA